MRYLVDTNILSEARKPEGNPNVREWFSSVASSSLFLSVLVIGEIRRGIERLRRRDEPQAAVFEVWLSKLCRDYAERMLPITTDVAEEWGRMNVPNPVPVIDGLLAATARVHGLTLVTRNVSDLAPTGVPLLNPFKSSERRQGS